MLYFGCPSQPRLRELVEKPYASKEQGVSRSIFGIVCRWTLLWLGRKKLHSKHQLVRRDRILLFPQHCLLHVQLVTYHFGLPCRETSLFEGGKLSTIRSIQLFLKQKHHIDTIPDNHASFVHLHLLLDDRPGVNSWAVLPFLLYFFLDITLWKFIGIAIG